ncbi:AraC family transcriptional regulator [Hymenobacter sp. YC55]|uniref:AraC family transcriptional regulator n=1 Tax=Hymenobacter sp. YC55 TaxID=3034019 RepID=UPI0023F8C35B|nr:AraC family transcriptional regulator [Hymenobacter sp. YC55]MDF7814033.1 AraC family transcriptional regulator [Hymenobacter sp. YC55]
MIKRATLEAVEPTPGSSLAAFRHDVANPCPVHWHYHPEYELVYVPHGSGQRQVGRHVGRYDQGELLLLGPHVPHLSYGFGQRAPFREVVVQFRADLLGPGWLEAPELGPVRSLLQQAQGGLVFADAVRRSVGPQVEQLPELPPWERLLSLLAILGQLVGAPSLGLEASVPAPPPLAQQRLNRVLTLLDQRLPKPVSVVELADAAALSVPAFCRFFKKMTQRTVTEFINEWRVQHACLLLREDVSITEVGYASGFLHLSHFNRLFRRSTGLTPSAYRARLAV